MRFHLAISLIGLAMLAGVSGLADDNDILTHPAYSWYPGNVWYNSIGPGGASDDHHAPGPSNNQYNSEQRRYLAQALPKGLKASDCGDKIGSAQLRHRGRGLFSWAEYTFDIKFTGDGGFTYTYNYGTDVEKATFNPWTGSTTYLRGSTGTKAGLNQAALYNLEFMDGDMEKLERQMSRSPLRQDTDQDVIACVRFKIHAFRDAINQARKLKAAK